MSTGTSSTSASPAEEAGIGRLAGVAVGVPDPADTAAFLADALAFDVLPLDGGSWSVVCEGDYGPRGQEAIRLHPAGALELREVTWEASEAFDPEALAARLRAAGLPAEPRADGGLGFADGAGTPLACVPAATRDARLPAHDPLRPRRLGHVNLKAPDPPAAARFYAEVLGLRLSEQIGEHLYFLRLASEHHNVGLRGGPGADLHHLGFEIEGWHVLQPILDRMAELGHTVEYGPGRHRPGNNIFTYLRDPSSGLRLELFADMAHIAGGAAHVPPRWEAGDRMTRTINRWGPTPPESFLA